MSQTQEQQYEVEKIIKHRKIPGSERGDFAKWELEIKWLGYESVDENTWEPLKTMIDDIADTVN